MKKTILTDNDYNLFYKSLIFGNVVDPVETSIKSSYRDVCRTITDFSKNEEHDNILERCKLFLKQEISSLNERKIVSQQEFDSWHKACCDKLISLFKPQTFYYGQAQKWLNMSLKNLSILNHALVEENYEFFHVPIDSYMVEITGIKLSTAWSRISSYDDYLSYQQAFREKYNGIPLDNEFKLWLKGTRDVS